MASIVVAAKRKVMCLRILLTGLPYNIRFVGKAICFPLRDLYICGKLKSIGLESCALFLNTGISFSNISGSL